MFRLYFIEFLFWFFACLIALLVIIIDKYKPLKVEKKKPNENENEKEEKDKTWAMVIVEPRNHSRLACVMQQARQLLPPEWKSYLFHGFKNQKHAQELATDWNAQLVLLETDNLTIHDYNQLLTSQWFWDQIDADYIFIYQTDVYFCLNGPNVDWQQIAQQYDYVGAPYSNLQLYDLRWHYHVHQFGNGGVSIRSKQAMIHICQRYKWLFQYTNEDMWFSTYLLKEGFRLPERDEAAKLFLEHDYMMNDGEPKYQTPFAVHQILHTVQKSNCQCAC
jgi:hypothetical protein